MIKKLQKSTLKTSKLTTQCKGDISHAFKTAKITIMMYRSPDVPLQDELLCSAEVFNVFVDKCVGDR